METRRQKRSSKARLLLRKAVRANKIVPSVDESDDYEESDKTAPWEDEEVPEEETSEFDEEEQWEDETSVDDEEWDEEELDGEEDEGEEEWDKEEEEEYA